MRETQSDDSASLAPHIADKKRSSSLCSHTLHTTPYTIQASSGIEVGVAVGEGLVRGWEGEGKAFAACWQVSVQAALCRQPLCFLLKKQSKETAIHSTYILESLKIRCELALAV